MSTALDSHSASAASNLEQRNTAHTEAQTPAVEEAGAEKQLTHSDSSDNGVASSEGGNPLQPVKKKGLTGVALVFACGASLFSDGYINAYAGTVTTLIATNQYADAPANELARFKSLFPSLAFAGTVVGMLGFGVFADKLSRKWGMVICSVGLVIFSILAAGAWGAGGSVGGLFAALIAYRFLIGIFIGGEYPCGSVACAENTEQDNVRKGWQQKLFVLATNCAIDSAFVAASIVTYILYIIFPADKVSYVWRLTAGLGAIPPAILLVLRARMDEPDQFKKGAIRQNLPWLLILRKYWPRLLAVSLVWFIYDFIAYPSGIYASYFTLEVIPNATLKQSLAFNIALNAAYLPGCFGGALIIDHVGPRNLIMGALALQAIFGFALAGAFSYFRTHTAGLIIMYYFFIAFGEAGPGNCLGLLASKGTAPSAVRGRFYGIAAAVGKVGAFVGTYVYTPLQARFPDGSDLQYSATFYLGSGLAVLAVIIIFFMIPPITQDGINKMDEEFLEYLRAHGYDMSNVGLADSAAPVGRLSEEQPETVNGTSTGVHAAAEKN